MGLHLHNTLSGEVEPFEPRDEPVSIYYCGLTVSDSPHLGHARSWVHVDVLRRWLEATGLEVRYVENFTDVNEKIVARIGEQPGWDNEPAVAAHFTDQALADKRRLNIRRAAAYPRVSEHVDEIIELIERLVESGYAYEANGSVYFDVPSFEGYGQLIDPEIESDEPDHPDKRHPADFALWKAGGVSPDDIADHTKTDTLDLDTACEGAQTWGSPWGEGRPGWHIECSAMSMTHLGETFDIHVAGRDIVFPHNENEIAQSEAATGQTYARYWLHVDLLEIDGAKMSSSLGNFLTVEEAVGRYGTNAVRTFLLSASHGTRQVYSEDGIEEAGRRFARLKRGYEDAVSALDGTSSSAKAHDEHLRTAVETARADATASLNANLDTRGAFVALEELAKAVTNHLTADRATPADYAGLLDAVEAFDAIGGEVLGLDFDPGRDTARLDRLLADLLALRESLRDAGQYDPADAIRDVLNDNDITIEDTDDGPRARLG